ncbi:MAG TPA: twin-arginine translocation signal domain-containing protein, partial [Verrucomicrobiota bacterium]|nr:twin-arginine translocation signal domain-containing protein [Verrucomicrobiota bacterium]
MRNNPSSQSVNPLSGAITRRGFIGTASRAMSAAALAIAGLDTRSQEPGQRPRKPDSVAVLNPRCRVPVGLIIDDSTCLVNLNRFAMPQFDRA